MNTKELRELPAVVDLRTAAAVLNIGRTVAYELVRAGQWPTPILRLGGRIKVPTVPLLELLGISTDYEARVAQPTNRE
jgi:predicted DNA-binding transcriptional regulator AlpA